MQIGIYVLEGATKGKKNQKNLPLFQRGSLNKNE